MMEPVDLARILSRVLPIWLADLGENSGILRGHQVGVILDTPFGFGVYGSLWIGLNPVVRKRWPAATRLSA